MARGMWTGIAAGFAKAQERKLLEQERQDKLGLAAQARQDMLDARAQQKELFDIERRDKLFSTFLTVAPGLAMSSALTPAEGGEGSSVGTSKFLEEQLARFKFPTEAILDLQEKGPKAMQLAIEVLKDNYDPEKPFTPAKLQEIADSVILEDTTQKIDPKQLAERFGLGLDTFPEDERAMREEILRRSMAGGGTRVDSTFLPEKPVNLEEVGRFQDTISKTLQAAVAEKAAGLPAGEREAFASAQTDLEKGNPRTAIELLNERGELEGLMLPLFEGYNGFKMPLGVFEPIRQALTPTPPKRTPTEAQIQGLRANRNDPAILKDFELWFGVSPEEYL
jgi:hypothetical protein